MNAADTTMEDATVGLEPHHQVYIRNLDFSVTQNQLAGSIKESGLVSMDSILEIRIVRGGRGGAVARAGAQRLCSAFVIFKDFNTAKAMADWWQGCSVQGITGPDNTLLCKEEALPVVWQQPSLPRETHNNSSRTATGAAAPSPPISTPAEPSSAAAARAEPQLAPTSTKCNFAGQAPPPGMVQQPQAATPVAFLPPPPRVPYCHPQFFVPQQQQVAPPVVVGPMAGNNDPPFFTVGPEQHITWSGGQVLRPPPPPPPFPPGVQYIARPAGAPPAASTPPVVTTEQQLKPGDNRTQQQEGDEENRLKKKRENNHRLMVMMVVKKEKQKGKTEKKDTKALC